MPLPKPDRVNRHLPDPVETYRVPELQSTLSFSLSVKKAIPHRQCPSPWLSYTTKVITDPQLSSKRAISDLALISNSVSSLTVPGHPMMFRNSWTGCSIVWLELYHSPVSSGRDYKEDNFYQLCIRLLGCQSGYPSISRLNKTHWPISFGLRIFPPCSLAQFLHAPVSFCWSLTNRLDHKLCLLSPMDSCNLWGKEDLTFFPKAKGTVPFSFHFCTNVTWESSWLH